LTGSFLRILHGQVEMLIFPVIDRTGTGQYIFQFTTLSACQVQEGSILVGSSSLPAMELRGGVMVFFGWSPEYSVQIEELDDQHKKLLEMMNEAYSAIQDKASPVNVSILLSEMCDYAIGHFSKEELLLKKFEYKHFDAQKKEHDFFFDQISNFKIKLMEGDPLIVDEIAVFLKTWFYKHIVEHDKDYSEFLHQNGIT
jgi:hemerythrin